MKVKVTVAGLGNGMLTNEHPQSSQGQPVLVLDEPVIFGKYGQVYRAQLGEGISILHPEDCRLSFYIHKRLISEEWEPGEAWKQRNQQLRAQYPNYPYESYSPEEEEWIQNLYIEHLVNIHIWSGPDRTFSFGASWQRPNTFARAEKILGKRIPRA